MIHVIDSAGRLDIVSPMPWGTRLLFALIALVPLLAPYELMLQVKWTDYWHPFFLLAAIISAGAVALSVFFVFAAAAGLSSRMTLDSARSTFTYSEVAPVVPLRARAYPLSSLEGAYVRTHEWSDGDPSYSLVVRVSHGLTFETGSSWARAEIESAKDRVEAFLDREPQLRRQS